VDGDLPGVIDLTHPVEPSMPVSIGFPRVMLSKYMDQAAGDVATVEIIQMGLHTGTHVDAPFHFIAGAPTFDQLDPLALSGSAVIVDVPESDDWIRIESRTLEDWEAASGERIGEGDVVLLRTSHARRWWKPLPAGRDYLTRPWPYLGSSAVDLLLERRICALGVECPDADQVDQRDLGAATFEVHKRLLAAGIPIIENLANLDRVPVARCRFLALGLPIRGASGSPIRALALLPGTSWS
jgi:arylformamidase